MPDMKAYNEDNEFCDKLHVTFWPFLGDISVFRPLGMEKCTSVWLRWCAMHSVTRWLTKESSKFCKKLSKK